MDLYVYNYIMCSLHFGNPMWLVKIVTFNLIVIQELF